MNPAIPWVLLRGLMRDGRHWGDFTERFAAAFPGAAVITLDFPGNGERHGQKSLASIEQTADFCRAELLRRGVAPPYRLLAMSMGAMVSASWASAYPQEIDAAVLINTSLRPYSRIWQRLRPRAWPAVLRLALAQPAARDAEAIVMQLTSQCTDERVLDDWTRWRENSPVSTANALRQLRAAIRFVAARGAPATRLLVLAGARDGLVHPDCSRQLARAWNCEIREHPQAGHDLPLDDGDWVVREVRRWMPG